MKMRFVWMLAFVVSAMTVNLSAATAVGSVEPFTALYPIGLKDSQVHVGGAFRRMGHMRMLYRRYADEVPLLAARVQTTRIMRNVLKRTRELDRHYCEWRYWGELDASYMDMQQEKGSCGYKNYTGGAHMGMDRYMTETVLVGVDLGVGYGDIEWDVAGSCGDYYMGRVGVYSGYTYDNIFWDNTAGYGINFVDLERGVESGGTLLSACGDFLMHELYFSSQGGFGFDLCGLSVSVVGGFDFVTYMNGSYEESGAGADNLAIDLECLESLKTHAGLKFGWIVEDCKDMRVMMDMYGRWRYEFMDDNANVARRLLTGTTATTVGGRRLNRHSVQFGMRIGTLLDVCRSVYLSYSGEIGDRYQVHSGALGVNF